LHGSANESGKFLESPWSASETNNVKHNRDFDVFKGRWQRRACLTTEDQGEKKKRCRRKGGIFKLLQTTPEPMKKHIRGLGNAGSKERREHTRPSSTKVG